MLVLVVLVVAILVGERWIAARRFADGAIEPRARRRS